MNRSHMCVSNVKYTQPTSGGSRGMGGLLKYLTYRESRDQRSLHDNVDERWLDHGMGKSVGEIAERCQSYQSKHVLMFSVAVNPNVDLIRMVAPEDRETFVRELTERVMEDFFEARGIDTGVEWSAVLHHRHTEGGEAPGQHNPHTHIVLPGSYYDADEGRRKPLYFSRNSEVNHIQMLHEVTQDNMVKLMERYVGRDWEHRYDLIAAVRERQLQITQQEPHDQEPNVGPVWAGVRRTDESTSAVGLYGHFENREGETTLQFRPLEADLSHYEAERRVVQLREELREKSQMREWSQFRERLQQREMEPSARSYRAPDIDF